MFGTLAFSFIGIGFALLCCAVIAMLLNRRSRSQERSFEESLDEIEKHLRQARSERGEL